MDFICVLFAAIVLIILFGMYYVKKHNLFKRMLIKIEETESDINVSLLNRHDVLVKMVDTARSYAEYEKKTLINVVEVRKNMSLSECSAASKAMDGTVKEINILAEAYPDLRSSENFKQLQIAIKDVEEHLQASRRNYNANVRNYNTAIAMFPSSIVASMMSLKEKDFFDVDEDEKADVNVSIKI